MRYKSVFIDLDDTLWDTFHNNKESLEEVFVEYRLNRHYASFEAFFALYSPNNELLWSKYRNGEIDRNTLIYERFAYMLRPMGISSREEVLAFNHDFLQRTTNKHKLIPGAIELLEYLSSYHYRLFILSNGFREVQHLKMKNSGLLPYFERLVLSEDAGIQKPNKRIFDFALVNTNSRRKESIMIGDSWEADILGAHQAKMDHIWYNPENIPARGFTPLHTIKSLEEVRKLL